jgi:hypothetical protein
MLCTLAFLCVRGAAFPVYDNMFYSGQPETATAGLVKCNILYQIAIWPKGRDMSVLPDKAAYQQLVRQHSVNPGPFVIDIEKLPLKGEAAEHNLAILSTLADWAREVLPGKPIGFYGYNTLSNISKSRIPLAKQLAAHVDVFFPSMYTFNDDQPAREAKMKAEADEDHMLGPGKPLYFYLWPQYHDKTPKAFQFVSSDYWRFQLDNAKKYGDGVVIWSSSKFAWNDATGWWEATIKFVQQTQPGPGAG